MANDQTVAPVIIKRKKIIAADGHHGGAWKVAYADFVTAMMAFFMLMWLLNATTEQQKKGIADYFSPTAHRWNAAHTWQRSSPSKKLSRCKTAPSSVIKD